MSTVASSRMAVFDVDGTLLPSPSLEVRFTIHLLKRNILPSWKAVPALAKMSWYCLRRGVRFRNCPRYWLAGMKRDLVQELARRFVEERIVPGLFEDMAARVEEHRRQGYCTVLLSGVPDFLLEPLGRLLQVDIAVGTRLLSDVRGRLSGEFELPRPHGQGKVHHLLQLARERDADLTESSGFANEGSDAYHLALLGRPTAVNPDANLARVAGLLGWPTITATANRANGQPS